MLKDELLEIKEEYEVPFFPDTLTASEVRLCECVLWAFTNQLLARAPNIAQLLNWSDMLSSFGAFTAAEGRKYLGRFLQSESMEPTAAEFFCLLVRCGYGGRGDTPSYTTMNKHARCSRQMYRYVVRLEQTAPRMYLPKLPLPEDVSTLCGILLSMQAWDALGLAGGKGSTYRRFYPFATSKNIFVRSSNTWGTSLPQDTTPADANERARAQEERTPRDGKYTADAVGVKDDNISFEEREFWRSRRNQLRG